MIALQDLDEEECVFKIPRNVLLTPNTSSISKTILEFTKDLPDIETRCIYQHVLVDAAMLYFSHSLTIGVL